MPQSSTQNDAPAIVSPEKAPSSPEYDFVDFDRPPDVSPGSERRFSSVEPVSAVPLVSVVIPFYNTGPVALETFACLRRQSLQDWEALVVDDGSREPESLELLAGITAMDARFRLVRHPENRGLSATRNTGAKAARGQFIVFLDSDDLLDATTLEKWAWFLFTHPTYAAVNSWLIGFGGKKHVHTEGFYARHYFLKHNRCSAIAMIRRDAFLETGGDDETIRTGSEDWDFWVRLGNGGRWGHTLREPLTWYRMRESHLDRWVNYGEDSDQRFRRRFPIICPRLFEEGFPAVDDPDEGRGYEAREPFPVQNRLQKTSPRALLLFPSWNLPGNGDLRTSEWIRYCQEGLGWEVTAVACSLSGLPEEEEALRTLVTDRFTLESFLPIRGWLPFLHYLIESREHDTVILMDCEAGYGFLPFLKAAFPGVVFADLIGGMDESRRVERLCQLSREHSAFLDRHFAASPGVAERWGSAGLSAADIVTIPPWHRVPEDLSGKQGAPAEPLPVLEGSPTVITLQPVKAGRYAWDIAAAIVRQLQERTSGFLLQIPILYDGSGIGPETVVECLAIYGVKPGHYRIITGEVWRREAGQILTGSDIFLVTAAAGAETTFHICRVALAAGNILVGPVPPGISGREPGGPILAVPAAADSGRQTAAILTSLIEEPARRRRLKTLARELAHGFLPLAESAARVKAQIDPAPKAKNPPGTGAADAGSLIPGLHLLLQEARNGRAFRETKEREAALALRLTQAELKVNNFRGMIDRRDRKLAKLSGTAPDERSGKRVPDTDPKKSRPRRSPGDRFRAVWARARGALLHRVFGRTHDRYGITTAYLTRKEAAASDGRGLEDEPQDGIYQAAYHFLVKHSLNSVLDVGCGSGFKLMKYFAGYRTVGMELPPALDHLTATYPARDWRRSDFKAPVQEPFDLVMSVDVIEHLTDPDGLMEFLSGVNCRFIVLATPDRASMGEKSRYGPPVNRHHIREWTRDEFVTYVSRWFTVIEGKVLDHHAHYVIAEPKQP